LAGSKIDVNFINPFINGAIETFKVQCSISPKAGKPFVKGTAPPIAIAIVAVIELNSASFNGSISICFPEPVFLSIMEKMLGEAFPAITKDLEDGASELLNIIFGQAKKVLNERGLAIKKAIPSIIRDQNKLPKGTPESPILVLPFDIDTGTFHIEIFAGGS
jgi:chemotaxis protein CheX